MYSAAAPLDSAKPTPADATPGAGVLTATRPAEAEAGVFARVPAALRNALVRRGFTQLTSVQSAILAADDGARDLQISSQTGSGKTVAIGFVLAPQLLAKASAKPAPTTLIITPTRELAMQVRDELGWLLADVPGAKLDCVTGGMPVRQELIRLRRPPTILVGTPGRLLDHVRTQALDLSGVQQVVLDEADQMLDLGFRDDLVAILAAMPAQRRTHLISATFPRAVRELTREFQRNALHVEGTALGTAHEDIEHTVHAVDGKDRYAALVNLLLLAGGERTLVFVRTRIDTGTLADKLTASGIAAQPISGELSQVLRTRTLEAFRRGTITTLIATDVAARGLDIPDVTTVVHFDPPTDGALYTHRSGRTGRAGQKGHSVLLAAAGAKRRVQRILHEAKVVARWLPAPDAKLVQARLQQRTEQRLRQMLREEQPNAQQLALATTLLAEFAPAQLVAALLHAVQGRETAAPLAVAAGTSEAAGASTRGSMRDRDAARVRFRINWGAAQGAMPKRILAHICRRGDIRGADVGAIEVLDDTTTFDVAAEVAEGFAARVAAPDAREPHLCIERDQGRGAHRGAHRAGRESGHGMPRGGHHRWAPSPRAAARPWSKRPRALHREL